MSQKDEGQHMRSADSASPAATGPGTSDPPPELGKEIAKQLKTLYGRHIAEPLPDKFAVLLDQLAKAERKG